MEDRETLRQRAAYLALAAVNILFLLYGALTYYDLTTQIALGWGIFFVAYLVSRKIFPWKEAQRLLLLFLCTYLSLRYWMFRTFDTLFVTDILETSSVLVLYLAETYSILVLLVGLFANVAPLQRKVEALDTDRDDLPTVDIFIPTYSEPEEMVAVTAIAATQIDYPRDKVNVYILDDGGTYKKRHSNDPQKAKEAKARHFRMKHLAQQLRINYITREENIHAKAGNINHAIELINGKWGEKLEEENVFFGFRERTSLGELLLILDCDHVPTHDFLKNTVGYFLRDPKLFLVQTPHFFINPDPIEKNLNTFEEKPSETEMFFGAILKGLDFWNGAFFCGSAGLLRTSMLLEAGGMSGETIVEDCETSLVLHSKGYNSVYVDKPMICGLSPETYSDFITQRNRWAQGMIQIFMLKNPAFFGKLRFYQRLCYLNSCLFWFFGFVRFVFILAPLTFVFFDIKIYNASLIQIAAYTLPHIFIGQLTMKYLYGQVRHPFFSELYETVLGIYNVPMVLGTMLNPRRPTFKVTPKTADLREDVLSPMSVPFYLLLLVTLAAVPFLVHKWIHYVYYRDALVMCIFWMTYNVVFILLCLGVVYERRQIRKDHRIFIEEDVEVSFADREGRVVARLANISLGGMLVRLPKDARISRGDTLTVHAVDSYGAHHAIRANVLNRGMGKDWINAACQFSVGSMEELKSNVSFFYGDSSRWVRFWERRRSHDTGVWSNLGYLLQKGIKGCYRNLVGLVRLLYLEVKGRLAPGAGTQQ